MSQKTSHPKFNKTLFVFLGLLAAVLGVAFGRHLHSFITITTFDLIYSTPLSPYGNLNPRPDLHTKNCTPDLWSFVYKKQRLYKIDDCISVTGTITSNKNVDDGDNHILVRLDNQYKDIPSFSNYLFWRGDLVVETICQVHTEKEESERSCKGFTNFVDIPRVGSHVRVTGTYVLDKHYGWKEIHPAYYFELLPN